MFDARPPLTNMMVSSKQKRRSWTGNTFSSDVCNSQRKGTVLCISENTQDKARKCEVAGRLGSSEQEAGGDVWAFAEADSESGKEPWQAGKWLAAKMRNENEQWECVSRAASWMRAWTLWSPRFGSFGSESSQVSEIFDLVILNLLGSALFSSCNNVAGVERAEKSSEETTSTVKIFRGLNFHPIHHHRPSSSSF